MSNKEALDALRVTAGSILDPMARERMTIAIDAVDKGYCTTAIIIMLNILMAQQKCIEHHQNGLSVLVNMHADLMNGDDGA